MLKRGEMIPFQSPNGTNRREFASSVKTSERNQYRLLILSMFIFAILCLAVPVFFSARKEVFEMRRDTESLISKLETPIPMDNEELERLRSEISLKNDIIQTKSNEIAALKQHIDPATRPLDRLFRPGETPLSSIPSLAMALPSFHKVSPELKGYVAEYDFVAFPNEQDVFISKKMRLAERFIFAWRVIEHIFRPSAKKKNVIDIGANIGAVCVTMASLMKQSGGKIFCIEASPDNFALLFSNVALNSLDNVYILNYAITDDVDAMPALELHVNPDNKGGNSVFPSWNDSIPTITRKIPTITLDILYSKFPEEFCEVDMIKIDVEGSEGRVILGAEKYFRECPPCCVLSEVIWRHLERGGTPVSLVWETMKKHGYTSKSPAPVTDNGDGTDFMFQHSAPHCQC